MSAPPTPPARPGRPRSRAVPERQQELIDAAAAVFSENGYAGSSIQQIADRLDIRKGSIYHYVDSKDDLLYAVINEIHESALATMTDLPGLDLPPLDKLRLFVRRHVQHSIDHVGPASVFFRDFRALGPDRRAEVLAERARYSGILRALIDDAAAAQLTDPDLDRSAATLAILGMTNWVYQWYRPEGSMTPTAIAEAFAGYAIDIVT